MKRNQDKEKELRELSQSIVEALAANEEVMSHLSDLKERGIIDPSTLLGLALKVDDLLQISGVAFMQDTDPAPKELVGEVEAAIAAEEEAETSLDTTVDGRKLSTSEVAFTEWAASRFDEKQWLKELGLLY